METVDDTVEASTDDTEDTSAKAHSYIPTARTKGILPRWLFGEMTAIAKWMNGQDIIPVGNWLASHGKADSDGWNTEGNEMMHMSSLAEWLKGHGKN